MQLGVLVKAMRAETACSLAAGFGISTGDQAGQVAAIADGVVVGSAFVRIVEKHAADGLLEAKLEEFARELRTGMGR